MKRIEQTTAQQTSNRSVIQACRVDNRPRVSVAATIAADAFSLTLAWILCTLIFQLAGRPSPFLARFLVTLPFTLAFFARNGLYPAFGMERTKEIKRVVMCVTGVQAGCAGAFWLLHVAGGLASAIALGSLSIALVPIGRLLTGEVMNKKRWWKSQSVIRIHVEGETEHAVELALGVAEPGALQAAGTSGRFISSEDHQKLLTPRSTIWKRLVDVPVALTAGVVLLPLIATIIAAVKLTSPGKIFYGHPRVGRNKTAIRVWKFRTMVKDADVLLAERLASDPSLQIEWEQKQKLRNDPRLTPIGNFLRRYSLDELPQLWNVIKGEMSIVGPRPIIESEIPKYGEYFVHYTKVLPGITGLWQVSGRNETTYQQRVHLDSYYVNNWSPLLDLYILFRTVKAVVSARGAY